MTHADWMALLNTTLIVLLPTALALAGAVLTGLTRRTAAWLDAKGQSEASKVLTDANTRVQAAMANEAGQLALRAQAGTLDLTDLVTVRREAETGAKALTKKLPDAMRALQPIEGALAAGILGKLGAMTAPALVAANDAAATAGKAA